MRYNAFGRREIDILLTQSTYNLIIIKTQIIYSFCWPSLACSQCGRRWKHCLIAPELQHFKSAKLKSCHTIGWCYRTHAAKAEPRKTTRFIIRKSIACDMDLVTSRTSIEMPVWMDGARSFRLSHLYYLGWGSTSLYEHTSEHHLDCSATRKQKQVWIKV